MPKAEFGVRLPHSGPVANLENIDRVIDEAERLGFHSVWVHNHVNWGRVEHEHHIVSGSWEALKEGQNPNFFESFTTLAYAAAKSKRVKIGVAALVMSNYHPVILAKQLANLDNLSRGRLQIVVGLGSNTTVGSHEFEVLGIPLKTRRFILEEKARAIREIWAKPEASFHGRYVNFDGAVIYPKPVQKPYLPMIYGGHSLPGMDRAARLFDGWFPGYRSPPEAKEAVAEFYEKAKSYGRGNQKFTMGVEKKMHIKKTHADAIKGVTHTLEANVGHVEEDLPLERILGESLIGSEQEIFKQVEGYVDAGLSLFEMKPIYKDVDELVSMMKDFSKVIFPSFS